MPLTHRGTAQYTLARRERVPLRYSDCLAVLFNQMYSLMALYYVLRSITWLVIPTLIDGANTT